MARVRCGAPHPHVGAVDCPAERMAARAAQIAAWEAPQPPVTRNRDWFIVLLVAAGIVILGMAVLIGILALPTR